MTFSESMNDPMTRPEARRKPPRRIAVIARGGTDGQPLYKAVKLEITRVLSGGALAPGGALPTEKELAAQYGVSIGTVRRAIDELVAERIVVRQQGRGTFLEELSHERMLNHFWRVVRKDGVREVPIVQTLSFRRAQADAHTAKALAIRPGAAVFHIVNLLLLGGRRVLCDDVKVPLEWFPGLTHEILVARRSTMYGLYQSHFGISVIRIDDRLGAVAADRETAKRLQVPARTPLLEIRRVAYTFGDKPVEMRHSLFLTEDYEYRNTIGGVPS